MTHRIPNDKDERMEFLRHLHKLRNEINGENVKVKNRRFEKQYLWISVSPGIFFDRKWQLYY